MQQKAGAILLPPGPALRGGFAERGAVMVREWAEAAGSDGAAIRKADRR